MYGISIVSGIATFFKSGNNTSAEGDWGAIAVWKNLAQDMALTDMPGETAIKCLHTMAARVAETVDSVGGRSGYGIDMVALAETGTVKQIPRNTDKTGTIRVRFEESDEGQPSGRNGGA